LVIVAQAQPGGDGPLSRLIRWLYRITGQAEPIPPEKHAALIEAGLSPRTVWEMVGHSHVMLIVAEVASHG
jgi:hypothetical protein